MNAVKDGRRVRRAVFVAAVTAALAFAFVLRARGDWVWDDVYLIERNPELVSGGGLRAILTHDLWGGATGESTQLYHPVPVALHWLEAQIFGVSLRPMRLVNVLLHAFNGALLYVLLRRRLERSEAAAALGTTVFLLHPAATEPVMWLSAHDLPGVAFTLGACLLVGPTWTRAGGAAVCVFFAFLSKELYVVAPVLALLGPVMFEPWRRKIWRFGVLAVVALSAAFALRRALGISAVSQAGLGAEVEAGGSLVLHYATELVTFTNSPTIMSYVPLSLGVALLVLAGALALVVALLRFSRGEAHGALWIGIALAPNALAIPFIGLFANRYAYLPLVGFAIVIAAAWDKLGARIGDSLRSLLAWAALPVALVLGLFTAGEASLWANAVTLFGADVEREPDDAKALYHYGHAVFVVRGCADAIPIYERSVQSDPTYQRAWHNVAGCLINQHQFRDAVRPARTALALAPDDPRAEYNLGVALVYSAQLDEGIAHLERSNTLRPARATEQALVEARAKQR